jgi:hypothetical protein
VAQRHKRAKRVSQHKRSKNSASAKIADVFQRLSLPTVDRSLATLNVPYFDPTGYPQSPGVEYRTILTNGTGRTLGLRDAQLE